MEPMREVLRDHNLYIDADAFAFPVFDCSGRGVCEYADGSEYDGEWRAGKMDGRGTMRYADGGEYVGEWRAACDAALCGAWFCGDCPFAGACDRTCGLCDLSEPCAGGTIRDCDGRCTAATPRRDSAVARAARRRRRARPGGARRGRKAAWPARRGCGRSRLKF